MDANQRELILKEEVYQIVGAAMEVSNQLVLLVLWHWRFLFTAAFCG